MLHQLYVANPTKFEHILAFRLPEISKLFQYPIGAGKQIPIPLRDPTHAGAIIQQQAKYGLVEAREAAKGKEFAGLLYSVERPVPLDAILRTMQKNDQIRMSKGEEQRKLEAAGIAANLDEHAKRNGAELAHVDVEFKEMTNKPDGKAENTQIVTAKGPRATRDPQESRGRGRKRGR